MADEKKEQVLSFEEALKEIKKGKKVARKAWANRKHLVLTSDKVLAFGSKPGQSQAELRSGDLLAEDYVIVK